MSDIRLLPAEILELIFRNLSFETIQEIIFVCKYFYQIMNHFQWDTYFLTLIEPHLRSLYSKITIDINFMRNQSCYLLRHQDPANIKRWLHFYPTFISKLDILSGELTSYHVIDFIQFRKDIAHRGDRRYGFNEKGIYIDHKDNLIGHNRFHWLCDYSRRDDYNARSHHKMHWNTILADDRLLLINSIKLSLLYFPATNIRITYGADIIYNTYYLSDSDQ